MARMIYKAGKEKAIRKHEYMPCIIAHDEDLTGEEWVRYMKRCYWSDYFTVAEWKTILNDSPKNPSVHKSNIKKKVTGWLMAMGRLGALQPDWLKEATKKAKAEYEDIIECTLYEHANMMMRVILGVLERNDYEIPE